jgi:hypothetical protein
MNLQNFIFWKDKIDYNKNIMSTKNSLIIVIGSAKQRGAQIEYLRSIYCNEHIESQEAL